MRVAGSPRGGAEPAFVAAAGSVVATDPRDGGLLAMASFPTYDPSDFVNGISFAQFDQLTSPDNFSPILNRAIQGTYAPGSTFKVVTAYAALEKGLLGPDSPIVEARNGSIEDTGTYIYPGCRDDFEASDTCEFESLYRGPAVSYSLSEALTVSSDVFFYKLGGEGFWQDPVRGPEGDEGIQAMARRFGLGTSSGIQLPFEQNGVVPDRDYFDAQAEAGNFLRDGSQWFAGDTILLAFGQSETLVTPTQLANLYATLANGGQLHQINIALRIEDPDGEIAEFGPRVLRDLELDSAYLAEIEEGLVGVPRSGVVNGTARVAFQGFPQDAWTVAGKTGTAQVTGKADSSVFAAYGPTNFGEPEIAIAVVLEEAGFGSSAAAPVARAILEPIATDSVPRARTFDELDREQAEVLAQIAADQAAVAPSEDEPT